MFFARTPNNNLLDSERSQTLSEQIEFSLQEVIKSASKNKTHLIFSPPASNIMTWRPNASRTLLSKDQKIFLSALNAFYEKNYSKAIADFKTLTALQPKHADTHFFLGLSYYYKNELNPSVFHLKEALRHDKALIRQGSVITNILKETAGSHNHTSFLDLQKIANK